MVVVLADDAVVESLAEDEPVSLSVPELEAEEPETAESSPLQPARARARALEKVKIIALYMHFLLVMGAGSPRRPACAESRLDHRTQP
jgi:hypothetical protein